MLKKPLLLLSALFASNVLASTVEFCPHPNDIHIQQGVLSAKTESGDGQWLGVSQEHAPRVKAFDSAIFYATKADGVGRLRACTYTTSMGHRVDLRYRPEVTPDIAIRLAYPRAWQPHEGPFGITYFQCRQQELQGCAFKEAK